MASTPLYVQSNPFLRVVYKTTILLVVLLPLVATALALRLLWQRTVHAPDLILLAVMYSLVAFGVTVGYHRMLTHRSFRAQPVVKLLLLILGSMAFEGPAIQWAATHTKHHARADREGDPHSPVDGFFHAHLGWIFRDGDADPRVYCRHLLNDRIVTFVSKTFLLWAILSLAIPFGIGWLLGGWALALTGLLWGGLVRMFLTHHVTWSVNSVCHTLEGANSRRRIEAATSGLLAYWHLEKAGTIITMRFHDQRSMACTGGSSTSLAMSSGRWNIWVWHETSTASLPPW